jgi:hypothetical protein
LNRFQIIFVLFIQQKINNPYRTMTDNTTTNQGSIQLKEGTNVNGKILRDLGVLREKMDLCYTMLHPGADSPTLSVNSSEAMMAVVGFLEACTPRMLELVEAATSGALSERVFEEVLHCNDRLQKLLADVETAALTETSASTTVASASGGAIHDQFDDLLLSDDFDVGTSGAPTTGTPSSGGAGFKSTGEDDDDEMDSKPPAIAKTSSNDEFDAFFATRQGS